MLGIPINIVPALGRRHPDRGSDRTPETAALAARYLLGLTWSMIPAWCFIAIRNFMGAVNRPEPGLWITLAAIPLNGAARLCADPRRASACRDSICSAPALRPRSSTSACAPPRVWICYACRPFRKYRVLGRFWRADWALLRQAVRDRRADLGRDDARMGPVLLGCAAGRLDRHDGARRASDRAAGRRDPVHGAVRHFDRRDRARRPRGRPPRSGRERGAPASARSRSASAHHGRR